MRLFASKKSIHKRLLALLIVCISASLIATAITQLIVYNLATEGATNIQLRNRILAESRILNANLVTARDLLTYHLLTPDQNMQQKWAKQINEILLRVETIKNSPWIKARKFTQPLEALKQDLQRYDGEIQKLIALRLNAEKQHPALYYARETMLPFNRTFLTASTLALEELEEEQQNSNTKKIYHATHAARYLWVQLISSFRMYIINRLGSFDENSLRVQEKDIETLYQQLHKDLLELHKFAIESQADFVVEEELVQMIQTIQQWKKDFDQVRTIHISPNWRMDVIILDESIKPLAHKIQTHIDELEAAISDSAARDVTKLAGMGEDIVVALWSLMLIAAIIAMLGFIYLNRSVLQPIKILTRAIKAEATDGQRIALPNIDSEETQNLIEAFTIMRKQVHTRQTALEHQAMHDALTGLPNRNLLYDRIQQTINKLHREQGSLVLMMMDLDRFKDINDTLGHQVGDRILEQVSLRLVNTLRDTDTVARLGGDEFAVALPLQDQDYAEQVANKILSSLEKPFHIDGYQLFVGASIGMAIYPQHGKHVETLLRHADIAMYASKRNNSGYRVYNAEEDKDRIGRLALSNDLRQALNAEELMVYYQPKLDIQTGTAYGVEALVRWQHPERGFIPPDQIIYIAEHTGLIKQLTHWVLKEAISQCSHWARLGKELSVSVNLSTRNLQDPGLYEIVENTLTLYEYDPELLTLEITESAMMMDPEHASQLLHRMDAMGVCISIDDFGTGFSSLAYLKQLPVDELKIDKSFVMNIDNSDNDAVIVRSTIDLAKNLGLKVVAEGVENAATWDLLAILGCDCAQGFYMSKPLSADALERWLYEHPAEKQSSLKL